MSTTVTKYLILVFDSEGGLVSHKKYNFGDLIFNTRAEANKKVKLLTTNFDSLSFSVVVIKLKG